MEFRGLETPQISSKSLGRDLKFCNGISSMSHKVAIKTKLQELGSYVGCVRSLADALTRGLGRIQRSQLPDMVLDNPTAPPRHAGRPVDPVSMGEPTLIERILLDSCLESEKTAILVVHRDTTQMFQMWRPRVAKSGGHLNYNTGEGATQPKALKFQHPIDLKISHGEGYVILHIELSVTEVQDPDDAQSFSLALPQEAGAARSRLVPLLKEAVQVTSSRMVQTSLADSQHMVNGKIATFTVRLSLHHQETCYGRPPNTVK